MPQDNSALKNLNSIWSAIKNEAAGPQSGPPPPTTTTKPAILFQEGLEKFNCDFKTCGSRCCQNHEGITLLLKDIAILQSKGLEDKIVGSFSPPEKVREFIQHPRITKPIELPSILHVNDRCIFLNEKSECDIYPFRPIVCKSYPFVLKTEKTKDKIYYKFSIAERCPYHLKEEKFHPAREVSPYLLEHINAAVEEQWESYRTLSLLSTHREELVKAGFAKYLKEE